MPRLGTDPGRCGPRPAAPLAAALALLWLVGPPTAPGQAAPADGDDLDALIQETLDGVPAEQASEVVAWILEAYEGTIGYLGVSPGSLYQSGTPSIDQVLDTASGSLSLDFSGGACSYAPIHLPQGATITAFLFWVHDQNSADDATASLRRFRIDGSTGVQELALLASSGAQAGSRVFSDFTISNGVVDNLAYWYFVWVCLPSVADPDGPTHLRGLYVSYSE